MRSSEEMMNLILEKATLDPRIRAVTLEGSRANKNAVHDQYSDFDICYIVEDIREFTRDHTWISYFGDILIVQCPCDWYSHRYDYTGHDDFTYLIQLKDGNRIDLNLMDVRNIKAAAENTEPRTVLLNKDGFPELTSIEEERTFYVRKPSEMEFLNTCNEFRWVSLYISKGLCRDELYYAKYAYDVLTMDMFLKMLNWKVGVDNDFAVTTGSHGKYLKRFLSAAEMERFRQIFPDGTYEEIWEKLFVMYDYFAEIARYVGQALGYGFDERESAEVRGFLAGRRCC